MAMESARPSGPIASRTKIQLVHSALGLAALALCALLIDTGDSFLNAGQLFGTPILPILVGVELVRMAVNRRWLNLVAHVKFFALPGQNFASRPPERHSLVRQTRRTALLLLVGFAVAFVVCVIFGAPILEQHAETATLSAVLVASVLLPLVLFVGPLGALQFMFCDEFQLTHRSTTAYLELVQRHSVCAMLGCWSASALMVLDWDRDWQAYPLPNVYGTMAGVFVGNVVTLLDVLWRLSGLRLDLLSYLPDDRAELAKVTSPSDVVMRIPLSDAKRE